MYWRDKRIYQNIISMNGEGNCSPVQSLIENPTLADYFTFFINNKDYGSLEQMFIETKIDLIDNEGNNLALLSGIHNSYKLLSLSDKFHCSPFKKNTLNVDTLMNCCYGNISYRFFYFYWKFFKQRQLKELIEKEVTKISFQEKIIDISFCVSRILTSDKNLLKLKYIYNNLPKHMQEEVRSLWYNIAYNNNNHKLAEFLSEERYLMKKLNKVLPRKLSKKSKKI